MQQSTNISSTFSEYCTRYCGFGFNGKEKDNEVKGVGNSLDFGARIYDSRTGRWLSVDPESKRGPQFSPYCFGFNNPIMLVDKNGQWPGVTFMFFEIEGGIALGYGVNYIEQSGIAWDEVGKTHFTTVSALYIVNQKLEEGSKDPQFVLGASLGISANITQNWDKSTFREYLKGSAADYDVPTDGPSTKVGFGLGVGFNAESLTLSAGLQAGVKFSVLSTNVKQSISLNDKEADIVNDATDVWSETWIVNNPTTIRDKRGGIIGYEASVATKDKKGKLIDTGVKIFSGVNKDKKGNTTSNNVWSSKAYQSEANKAEKED